jgi:hypothetical protein
MKQQETGMRLRDMSLRRSAHIRVNGSLLALGSGTIVVSPIRHAFPKITLL